MAANDSTDDRRTERAKPVQRDVAIHPDVWAGIVDRVRELYDRGEAPMDAWRQAVREEAATTANIVVKGEVKNLEDIDGVPLPDEELAVSGTEVAQTEAYIAVGLLSDAIGAASYHHDDVEDATVHLERGREAADPGTETAQRITAALGALKGLEQRELDERRLKARDALAELAPVAAGLSDYDGVDELNRSNSHRPKVPVFYNIPRRAADRAVARFKHRRERLENGAEGKYIDQSCYLQDLLCEEIEEDLVIRIDGETLAAYASRMGLDSMTIDAAAIREGADE